MKDWLAAERYARALFEIVAARGNDRDVEAELESFSASLKAEPEFGKFLNNPSFRVEQKRKLLETLYPKNKTLLDFLTLLFEKNRFNLIHEIAVSFKKIADMAQGEGLAEIQSAVALDAQSEKAIVSRLEKISGQKLVIKKAVNPALVGGVVVRMQNKVLDGSVKFKIETLKREMTKIATF